MFTVFLAGGIGSGKSTVARWLEELGCARIDLDQLSREVLVPGSPTLLAIAEAFGSDLLDVATGALDRRLLAQRAFATPEETARLEAIELPAIMDLLAERIAQLGQAACAASCVVVEIPLLDRLDDAQRAQADEIVVVACPRELRRERAIGRGMTGEDFDVRAAQQPTDEWLDAHATTRLDNTGSPDELRSQVQAWFAHHEAEDWL